MKEMLIIFLLLILTATEAASQTDDDCHLYAVLISGGRNKMLNHERYWNDCSLLFSTLRHTYHLPKQHIVVVMSDGGNPAADMLKSDGTGFANSPADLDGDGDIDVFFPATRQDVGRVLQSMAVQLGRDDHLFLFLIDHGGLDEQWGEPYVYLWNDERLRASELRELLGRFRVGTMSLLLGQCYAGGFLTALQGHNRVVAAACGGDELSWVCEDLPYDEFVYHWTCAVAGTDLDGFGVDADADGDGRVSMSEAFACAARRDRRPETPQYNSQPATLGDRWSFWGVRSESDGVSEVVADAAPPAAVFSLSGIRHAGQSAGRRSLYISRQGGRVRKILK